MYTHKDPDRQTDTQHFYIITQSYQMSHNNFRSLLDGKVEGSVQGWILHLWVDVRSDAHEEHHRRYVLIDHRLVHEVVPMTVKLWSNNLVILKDVHTGYIV